MTQVSTWLADRVASLLPSTEATACVGESNWNSCRYNKNYCAYYGHYGWEHCHLSCHGKAVCGAPYTCCDVG